jgi:transcriptional regulator of acetoin/glycerol metabolism
VELERDTAVAERDDDDQAHRDVTVSQTARHDTGKRLLNTPEPGIVTIYAGEAACFALRVVRGACVIGRGTECDVVIDDRRASRRHTELSFDGEHWLVRDLGSHNGTFLDGERVTAGSSANREAVLAIAGALFLLSADVRPLIAGAIELIDTIVVGPQLRTIWNTIAQLAKRSKLLHLTGETGTGKEVAARHFHASSGHGKHPFVAVNCAAIQPALAERLLFGARRGAYSGADADSDGYLIAADGGTLFLDEIGELSADVQAKLLRAIETGEVMSLGAAKARKVDIAICSATHADLRARVADRRFREDLYFRIAQPAVELPPLRARREDIPWIIGTTLRRVSRLKAHTSYVEAALLRPWPGNARELVNAVASAAHGICDDRRLVASDLGELVGRAIGAAVPQALATATESANEDDTVLAALKRARGNISRAALALGLHRNQLRRWLERHQVDARSFKRRGVIVGNGEHGE